MTLDDTQQSIVSNTPGADIDPVFGATESQVAGAPIFGGLDLSTSSLLPNNHGPVDTDQSPSTAKSRAPAYDPVAELLGLDTDSDSDNNDDGTIKSRPAQPAPVVYAQEVNETKVVEKKAKSKRKPLNVSRFALKPKGDKGTVVGRMATASGARRKKLGKRIADSSSSDNDTHSDSAISSHGEEHAPAAGSSQPSRALINLRIDSDSESDSNVDSKTKQKDSEGQKRKDKGKAKADEPNKERKERAASKAAIALMHRETERLVRETAVKIEPLEFTKRLELEDFFARFSAFSMSREVKPTVCAPSRSDPKMSTTFHYESDSGDYDVEIIDSFSADAADPMTVLSSPTKKPALSPNRKPGTAATDSGSLDAILNYGSQPLHASARMTSSVPGIRRTDGPLALKELSDALLNAVYRKEKEAREAKESKARKKREQQQQQQEVKSEAEIVVEDGDQPEDDSADENEDDQMEVEDNDEDGSASDSGDSGHGDSDDGDIAAQHPSIGIRPRVVAVSDDEDEAGGDSAEAEKKLSKDAPPNAPAPEPAATKSKFIGMFKMPARPKRPAEAAPQPVSPKQPQQRQEKQPSPATPSSQRDPSVDVSQDLAYMFSSQMNEINTQDSLLMTPSQQSQFDNGFEMSMATQAQHVDVGSQERPTQPTQPLVEPTQFSMGITQPTQPMADGPTQPTQSMTTETESVDADVGFAVTAAEDDGLMSVLPTMVRRALNPKAEEDGHEEEEEDDDEPVHRRRIGRLIRRSSAAREAKKKNKAKKRKHRSEFIEAEAEVGESSDSDNNHGNMQLGGKFAWGAEPTPNRASVSSDESDSDLDSDEEALAMLADPMIDNNDLSSASSDEHMVRELHRQQDFDQDERDIQELARDIATGNLRNRSGRGRSAFALNVEDEENYIDRQDRAERMEERVRLRRRMEAREIHDTNLAAIAKNPETAAFARAALMRPPPPSSLSLADGYRSEDDLQLDLNDDDDDDDGDGAFALEEVVDDRHVAAAIEQQLARRVGRSDSDADSETEGSGKRSVQKPVAGRVAGSLSHQLSAGWSDLGSGVNDGDIDGELFTSVSVEKLIVRRSTLLKRPGAPLASPSAEAKRRTGK
ncbi:hypothetical protein LPJ57_001689 [Coemansia sp. RSA 486]|nr:hypothetical protein LPJ57_001689 [Coemansia sp. RSA 486]